MAPERRLTYQLMGQAHITSAASVFVVLVIKLVILSLYSGQALVV